ncbi:unnamed protein product [Lactuca saligna]|uniref:Uncharacterized protein n=1 Tax=Lactuca saligna TaxID=75948 RepID=A0AA35URU8_LACSI|nr:unnamed protein product [Lactuca saligna]
MTEGVGIGGEAAQENADRGQRHRRRFFYLDHYHHQPPHLDLRLGLDKDHHSHRTHSNHSNDNGGGRLQTSITIGSCHLLGLLMEELDQEVAALHRITFILLHSFTIGQGSSSLTTHKERHVFLVREKTDDPKTRTTIYRLSFENFHILLFIILLKSFFRTLLVGFLALMVPILNHTHQKVNSLEDFVGIGLVTLICEDMKFKDKLFASSSPALYK